MIFQVSQVPESLRAISIHAPHAYAIVLGIKEEEYRSKATKYRGWVLIHSSASKTSDEWLEEYGLDGLENDLLRQAIIGAAEITDCVGESGDYTYEIGKAVTFPKPIEGIKGQQSIFWGISDKYPERKAAFAHAWAMICEFEEEISKLDP